VNLNGINPGDTAWILASTALVLIMTPGLAFFYGGMVRVKSVLNMMMMSFVTIGIVSVLWVIFGFKEAFGQGKGTSGFIGQIGFSNLGSQVNTLATNGVVLTIPVLVFAGFQLMFAIITPALISGAIADRAKFFTWIVFVALWVVLVYFPVAHWVFDFGGPNGGAGWLAKRGVEDFAGGSAVHINAGAAGLALALVLGKRHGWRKDPMRPHNVPLVLIGVGLLWFGWFGFNAGSALAANGQAALAFMNTQVATAAGVLGWILVERFRDGKMTSIGAGSGAVAGLVAITPACAFIAPWAAVVLGVLVGIVCAFAVGAKYKLGFDDSLDVVGVHMVGGIVGCLFIGFFGTQFVTGGGKTTFTWGAKGLFYGGGWHLLSEQALGAGSVLVYSFTVSLILGYLLDKTLGFRITHDQEIEGIDLNEHAETGYDWSSVAGLITGRSLVGAGVGSGAASAGGGSIDGAGPPGGLDPGEPDPHESTGVQA
jgi:ammonium transporter, Amt family